jgi:hypothetical protein
LRPFPFFTPTFHSSLLTSFILTHLWPLHSIPPICFNFLSFSTFTPPSALLFISVPT